MDQRYQASLERIEEGFNRQHLGKDYGEVRSDTEILNQDGESIATCDVLTLVSTRETPDFMVSRAE